MIDFGRPGGKTGEQQKKRISVLLKGHPRRRYLTGSAEYMSLLVDVGSRRNLRKLRFI